MQKEKTEKKHKGRAEVDLIHGPIVPGLLRFALPLMAGNVLQQCYNLVDTLIVGRFVGTTALAAVGSAYTLMILINSIVLGLSMGAGAYLSIVFGEGDRKSFAEGHFMSFVSIGLFAVALNLGTVFGLDGILRFMQIEGDVYTPMRQYTAIILTGILASFLYNYFSSVLRAVGNSVVPLAFLAISSVLNIVLDLVFVLVFHAGVAGAAWATVISQYVSGVGVFAYTQWRVPALRFQKAAARFNGGAFRRIARLALLTGAQQSIMNFGILLVQGRVNSFGTNVMAAFAAAVKIDTLAYSPVQDFGNAYSTFVAQNNGARQPSRISEGSRKSALAVLLFCAFISAIVWIFGGTFIHFFADDPDVIAIGVTYLRIEGSFYALIGFLFMFYGYYRGMERPIVSIILTIISLGLRVVLAYALSALPALGVIGIWMSIPIGWAVADLTGLALLKTPKKHHVNPDDYSA